MPSRSLSSLCNQVSCAVSRQRRLEGECAELQLRSRLTSGTKVIKSKSSKYSEGTLVGCASPGWADYAVVDDKGVMPLPSNTGLPYSTFVGVLGGPGLTAYFGPPTSSLPRQISL
jgi:NADPH-dependent curcumin reductase CurA